jgi:hypothetical protein
MMSAQSPGLEFAALVSTGWNLALSECSPYLSFNYISESDISGMNGIVHETCYELDSYHLVSLSRNFAVIRLMLSSCLEPKCI